MTHDPAYSQAHSNGRVDVSVLVPVLNEERHIRESVAAMLSQRFEGEIEFLFMDGRSDDRTKAILEEMSAADRRIRVLDNPQRRTTFGLNIGLENARGDYIVRMDAHTEYPPEYVAKGIERLQRGDGVEWVTGPQIPQGIGPWSRRVAIALTSWLGAGGSAKWEAQEEKDIDTGVFTGVWKRSTLDEYGGWDDGWPVNQDSELAARFFERGARIVCMPELGALYVPRDSLKKLAKQYWRYGFYRAKTSRYHPASMRRSAVFPPALVLAVPAALIAPRPIRLAARAALAAWVVAVLATSARAARSHSTADAVGLPAVFAMMHFAWGLGFLRGCLAFGPPLAALARIAGFKRAD
jgi:glycosyltransferase involved in cell wall biosynthesis